MNILRQAWADIRRGENIDLYVGVVVAGGLAIVTLLGINTQTLVPPITLAVLALIIATNLGNRHRLEDIKAQISKNVNAFFVQEFPPGFKSDLDSAAEIWLIGVSLGRTVKTNYGLIEQKLRRGNTVRVMVVHPEGSGLEIAVSRSYSRHDIALKKNEILTTLQLLCDLRDGNHGGSLEIRTIANPLAYGAVALNPNSASGILYLEHFTFRISSEALPKFVLRASDALWYDFYKREISALWDAGVEWACVA